MIDDIVVEWGAGLYQDVIDRYTSGDEVINKKRKALVVYGGLHLIGRPLPRLPDGIVVRLRAAGVSVFIIASVTRDVAAASQPDVAVWQTPSLALVAGTPLGRAPAGSIPIPTEVLWDAAMIYEPRGHRD
jgi:hypothetical protein